MGAAIGVKQLAAMTLAISVLMTGVAEAVSAQNADRLELSRQLREVTKASAADSRAEPSELTKGNGLGSDSLRLAAIGEFRRRHDVEGRTERAIINAIAKGFSADELRTLVAFFRSPLGRKYLAVRADAGQRTADAVASAMQKYQNEFQSVFNRALGIPPGDG
jgi:hypothetical protein